MEAGRHTTVLFADVSGSTKLYETAGDAVALDAIGRCIEKLKAATHAAGGRVVKTIGDEIMAVFATPDAGGSAAAEMQAAVSALPAVGETRLGVKIGFHSGPVIQQNDDVFGDTVNMAARLVEQAGKGQIITSQETADVLGPIFKAWTRKLYPIEVKGKADAVTLCELVWNQGRDVTSMAGARPASAPRKTILHLKYRGADVLRRRETDSITLGREEGCDLMVYDDKASRRHCTIERSREQWVLKDHSTNGTYATIAGEKEILLQRQELALRKHGWIALGQPRAGTEEVVEYICEEEEK